MPSMLRALHISRENGSCKPCGAFHAAALFAVAAAITLGTASCTAASTSASAASSQAQAASSAQAAATEEQEVDLAELAQSLPEKGLPEKYIGKSWLGLPDKTENPQEGVAYYTWYSKNGKKDEVFFAACGGGVVVGTAKINIADYWPDYNGLPDLYGSGNAPAPAKPGGEVSSRKESGTSAESDSSSSGSKPNKYSPRDYDSAEDWEADTGGSIEEWDRH